MTDVRNKRVTVAGLGRFGGGIAVSRWLVEQGAARVLVTDKDPAEKLADSVRQLDGLPLEFALGGHREEDFTAADVVVTSPALPPTNPYLLAAKNAGVPVTTEIRLFVERCPCTILGVTGTKGKSTTSTLLHRMLSARYKTWLGGNLGGSLLADLPRMEKADLVVLELSSYMLWWLGGMRWSPHVGLVTLVTSDHLDWHGDVGAYVDAKRNLLRFQRPDDYAVVNEDDEVARQLADATPGKVVRFGLRDRRPFELKIPGRHNQLNAQGAFAAAGVLGVTWDEAQAAVREVEPLPHRLQLVHEACGVRWVNDSIATVPDAAVAALESFPPRRVIQIVGGYDNAAPVTALCNALAERAKAALCVGPAGKRIAQGLAGAALLRTGACGVYDCGDLAAAVRTARAAATPGDVVLLSPGGKSFDEFSNFEQRGDAFARLAREA